MKDIWYTRFNKEIEDAVKKNFRDYRILQRKELYQIEYYNEIKNYIDKLVKVFNELDRFPEEAIEETKKREVKNPDLLDHKVCSMCQIDQPLENFHFAKEHVDGHENTCKECVAERQEKFIKEKRETTEIPTEKACTQCEKILPLDSFYVDNQKFDRRGTKCKKCVKEVQTRDKDHDKQITEYKCTTCEEVKPIEEFHLLKRSKTGHRYSCKVCENKKGTERYHKLKKEEDELIELEIKLNADKDLTEEEKNNLKEEKLGEIRDRKKEELKQKRDEINKKKLETKIECPCGSITNELSKSRHEKTKKHQKYLESQKAK